ncbi:YheC/YheD family protein [Aquibacillus albus]|uniref:ATP-grasp domain-containing protein n=1 Tax=Aquibacillus albus TaxID=1168171 RepID=A0ABS2MZV2_9BACI|nr:YheC/YheD family protein [Aquibacillus albus]MBM7571438.1 hypothetical protein [Aquibacillus albus]
MIVPQKFYKDFQSIQTIKYGPYESSVECFAHHKDRQTLYISSKLKSEINLANNKKISLNVEAYSCTISLVLGVLIAGFHSNDLLLGARTELFRKMSNVGKELGYETIFFGHQHILSKQNKIYAYYLHENEWKQGTFDFPTVVYNRIPNRKTEHHPNVIRAKKLIETNGTLFNRGFFNKWEIYEWLMRSNESSYLLPESILHPSKQKIIQLLETDSLYIKPVHGSRGEGIIKCRKLETSEIQCQYYRQNVPQMNRYTDPNAFFNQHFPNGLKGYVVQKEIPLLRKGASAIDFRVHVNKNHRNSWEVTLICAKFAGKGSLTTHVQRGGSLHLVEDLFSKDKAKRMKDKLSKTALKVSNTLENYLRQPVGEIGFDFGIDEEGKVWMFEANSKPGFSVYDHPKLNEKAATVFSYPYKFAFYLHNLQMNQTD